MQDCARFSYATGYASSINIWSWWLWCSQWPHVPHYCHQFSECWVREKTTNTSQWRWQYYNALWVNISNRHDWSKLTICLLKLLKSKTTWLIIQGAITIFHCWSWDWWWRWQGKWRGCSWGDCRSLGWNTNRWWWCRNGCRVVLWLASTPITCFAIEPWPRPSRARSELHLGA